MTQREVMERILKAWQHFPELRLGQFLSNLTWVSGDIFYTENDYLAELAEKYAEERSKA